MYFRSQVYVQCWKLWCVSVILILWNIQVAIRLDLHFDFCIIQWFQQLYQAWILRELMKKKTAANISTKANDWFCMYYAFVAFINFSSAESFYSSPYTVRSSAKPIKTSLNTNWKLFYPCSCSCLSIVQAKHICFSVWLKNATYNNLCQCTKLELVNPLLHCFAHILYFQQ